MLVGLPSNILELSPGFQDRLKQSIANNFDVQAEQVILVNEDGNPRRLRQLQDEQFKVRYVVLGDETSNRMRKRERQQKLEKLKEVATNSQRIGAIAFDAFLYFLNDDEQTTFRVDVDASAALGGHVPFFSPEIDEDIEPQTESESLSGGAIAGIVIGAFAGVGMIIFGAMLVRARKRNREREKRRKKLRKIQTDRRREVVQNMLQALDDKSGSKSGSKKRDVVPLKTQGSFVFNFQSPLHAARLKREAQNRLASTQASLNRPQKSPMSRAPSFNPTSSGSSTKLGNQFGPTGSGEVIGGMNPSFNRHIATATPETGAASSASQVTQSSSAATGSSESHLTQSNLLRLAAGRRSTRNFQGRTTRPRPRTTRRRQTSGVAKAEEIDINLDDIDIPDDS